MKHLMIAAALMFACGGAFAEETMSEKASASAHDVKRSMKKGMHRTEEAVCAEGDLSCAAKKGKHRVQEGSDYVKDKAQEAKDKAD